jgi:hypothetical protein
MLISARARIRIRFLDAIQHRLLLEGIPQCLARNLDR